MSTKVVHFTFNGCLEKAEFTSLDSASDVREVFRSAAAASEYDILKLYNSDDSLIGISPHLESNTPESAYKLVIVATSTDSLVKEVGTDLNVIERRLEALESNIIYENGSLPEPLKHVSDKLDSYTHKLESLEQMAFIGLSKDLNGTSSPPGLSLTTNNNWKKQVPPSRRTTTAEAEDSCEVVFQRFQRMRDMEVRDEVKGLLEDVNFNNWQWNEPEMLVLLRQMYIDLGFLETFSIPKSVCHDWLCEVYKSYNRVPFHNFKHCFMVSQMMYGLIKQLNLQKAFTQEELFALLTSAVCHDLDHPGYNNTYQVNAQTELAVRYNDASPLENHHCSVAFRILSLDRCNILKNVSKEQFVDIRECMIRCILATDMAKHNGILSEFQKILPVFSFQNAAHRHQLMRILIKCADISNECRPMEVAEPWIDCLLQEFFNQSDLEKKEGLPVAPFMDREKVNKHSSQVNFIQFVLLPLFESLAVLYPAIQEPVLTPLHDALDYYLKQATVPPRVVPASKAPSTPSLNSNPKIVIPHTNGTA
ncbi:high affinity cGMP-specific 3',5'-cyclic phosphodiesterase 9A-like [Watersipora subatra]|uniref:high affinity cGMP-specific 3',5'-cyclic phosphodiesterase 9A-like n=1 Tax=Watersipora subatra TaxID=2589382 RepID=UPI00355C0485